jgi:hypothetical protein
MQSFIFHPLTHNSSISPNLQVLYIILFLFADEKSTSLLGVRCHHFYSSLLNWPVQLLNMWCSGIILTDMQRCPEARSPHSLGVYFNSSWLGSETSYQHHPGIHTWIFLQLNCYVNVHEFSWHQGIIRVYLIDQKWGKGFRCSILHTASIN